jgi:hypothetical protein
VFHVKHFEQLQREFPQIDVRHNHHIDSGGHSLDLEFLVGKLASKAHIVRVYVRLDTLLTQVMDYFCPNWVDTLKCISFVVETAEGQFYDRYGDESDPGLTGYVVIS